MPIHFRCPHCDRLLALGIRQGGTQIHCPMCDRVITVPPRTELQMPTTTVVLPDQPQAWWKDAPPDLPPSATPTVTDAWWLSAPGPSAPEKITSPQPPRVPSPIPETPPAALPDEPQQEAASVEESSIQPPATPFSLSLALLCLLGTVATLAVILWLFAN